MRSATLGRNLNHMMVIRKWPPLDWYLASSAKYFPQNAETYSMYQLIKLRGMDATCITSNTRSLINFDADALRCYYQSERFSGDAALSLEDFFDLDTVLGRTEAEFIEPLSSDHLVDLEESFIRDRFMSRGFKQQLLALGVADSSNEDFLDAM